MKNKVIASRFSFLFAFLILFLLQIGSAHAYTPGDANRQLNNANRELIRGNCSDADRFLDQADVTIDQILRNRTMKGCRAGPLNDLEGLAIRLRGLGGILERQCRMRRSYDNTLVNVRSWLNTKLCGAHNKQQQCTQYARTAVNQHQININKKCGFDGPRWSTNYTGHYNWCLGVSENAAHQETQARNISIDNCAVPGKCNHFIGSWKWHRGINVKISGNYRMSTSDNKGTWRCLPNGDAELRWDKGGWVDILSIGSDGNSLTGINQKGTKFSATRHQGRWYSVHSGPYGGGRLCLTAEEAARLKKDPNTRKITPLGGESCGK